jgi:hypothetical protein
MHTFCENIAKIYINLPVPNKFRRPSFFSSTLNIKYSIFIQQNKKIIIIKQLKTVNLFFIYIFVGNLFKSLNNGRRQNIDFEPPS